MKRNRFLVSHKSLKFFCTSCGKRMISNGKCDDCSRPDVLTSDRLRRFHENFSRQQNIYNEVISRMNEMQYETMIENWRNLNVREGEDGSISISADIQPINPIDSIRVDFE